jgi:hypothetical protein
MNRLERFCSSVDDFLLRSWATFAGSGEIAINGVLCTVAVQAGVGRSGGCVGADVSDAARGGQTSEGEIAAWRSERQMGDGAGDREVGFAVDGDRIGSDIARSHGRNDVADGAGELGAAAWTSGRTARWCELPLICISSRGHVSPVYRRRNWNACPELSAAPKQHFDIRRDLRNLHYSTNSKIVISFTNGAQNQSMMNAIEIQAATAVTPPPPPPTVAIGSGSPAAIRSFAADTTCPAAAEYNPGQTVIISSAITSVAAPHQVYESACQGVQTYTIPSLIAGSSYLVKLHFAELYFTAPNLRPFNVAINGIEIQATTAASAPTITTQPHNTTVAAGTTATFSVTRWRHRPLHLSVVKEQHCHLRSHGRDLHDTRNDVYRQWKRGSAA